MPAKYQGKYRIPSARASWWDYKWNAAYFVTICTVDRYPFFGKIVTGSDGIPAMQLSPIGEIASECWQEIPEHFPFVTLDAFIIMPNHIHGILVFNKPHPVGTHNHTSLPPDYRQTPAETHNHASLPPDHPQPPVETHNHASLPPGYPQTPVETHNHASLPPDHPQPPAETHNHASLPPDHPQPPDPPRGPQSQTLGSVIRGFKTGITIRSREIDPSFGWQTRFYDHIIRDDQSWQRIAQYICDNPLKWGDDNMFVENS